MVEGYLDNTVSEATLTIPSTAVSGGTTYNVTKINDSAFKNNTTLTNVIMPNSIETLGSSAFKGCSNLKNVTLSKNITSLSDYAFQNCSSLESITIPAATINIRSYVFEGCTSIQSVTIPAYCTLIDPTAFNGCTALQSFTVDNYNSEYNTIDGVLTNKSQTQIVAYPSAKGSTYTIPSSITYIGIFAFRGSELTSISIPAMVSEIGSYAFSDCTKLKKVVFEAKTSSISLSHFIFEGSPIETMEIYRNIGSGSYTPFYNNTALKSAIIGGNVTSLYSSMFYGCTSLSSVTLGDDITSIGYSAFQNCSSLASIKIPAKVTSIGDSFLSGCSGLQEIHAKMANPPVLQTTAFTGVDKDACKLIVPGTCIDKYNSTPGWMAFNNIIAEDDASLRKMTVNLTDGGTVSIDSHTYNGEGSYSFNTSATTDLVVIITPSSGYYLKSVKMNDTNVTGQMEGNTLTLSKSNTPTILDITFAPCTETTDISALDYAVYPTVVSGVAGKTLALPVNLKNANLIATWQADLVLPEGFTIAKDAYGDPMIKVSGSRTTSARHSIATSTLAGGGIRILYNSSSNKTISGKDGEVATITLNVAEGLEADDYPIIFKNIVMSEANETGHKVDQVVSKITVQTYTPGDVNNDGEINAQDLVAVVNYILENPTSGNIREAADLNNDGNVDAMDYVAEVNLILNDGASSAKARAKGIDVPVSDIASLYLDPFCIAPGEEKEIIFSIDDINNDYVCCQFDVTLPAGISVIDAESEFGSHSVAYRTLKDGSTRLLLASPSNNTIHQSEGGVIRLTLKADKNVKNGQYVLETANTMLVTANAQSVNPDSASFVFTVGDATGINSINASNDNEKRYNIAGQRVNASAKGLIIVNGKKTIVK